LKEGIKNERKKNEFEGAKLGEFEIRSFFNLFLAVFVGNEGKK
jgi:hypothetical protein